MSDLYQEIILDYYQHPRNRVSPDELSHLQKYQSCSESNVGCGDEFSVALQLDEAGKKVVDVKWSGQGCAISTASMSVVSEYITGKTVAEIRNIGKNEILELLGLEDITPAREKCLLLSMKAVNRVLEQV